PRLPRARRVRVELPRLRRPSRGRGSSRAARAAPRDQAMAPSLRPRDAGPLRSGELRLVRGRVDPLRLPQRPLPRPARRDRARPRPGEAGTDSVTIAGIALLALGCAALFLAAELAARVLVPGGSVVECWYIDQPSAWPQVIERCLNEPASLAKLGVSRAHVGSVGRSLVTCAHIARMLE